MKNSSRRKWVPRLILALVVIGTISTTIAFPNIQLWYLGLFTQAELSSSIPTRFQKVVVDDDLHIPMRDSMILIADLYRPAKTKNPLPTILVRLPYGKREAYTGMPAWGRFWAQRGYAFVVQDVRGKFASAKNARFKPFVNEVEDGYDTLEWIKNQPWSNGSVGQMGASYYGYTSLASAASKHPALKCISPAITAANFNRLTNRQGAFMFKAIAGWKLEMDAVSYQDTSRVKFRDLPLASIGKNAGISDTLLKETLDQRAEGNFFALNSLEKALLNVKIPILHRAGFYDNLLGGNLSLWSLMTRGAAPSKQWLLIGPWDHELTTENSGRIGQIEIGYETFATHVETLYSFFEFYLYESKNDFDKRPQVTYFNIGENTWGQADQWPPKEAKLYSFYLHTKGRLSQQIPTKTQTDNFVYNPADPVSWSAEFSPWQTALKLPDRKILEQRKDILFYDSEPLKMDLNVTGNLEVKLYVSSSAVDTDFTATLVDLHPDGYAHFVQNGIIRVSYRNESKEPELLEKGQVYEIDIDLWATSYIFKKNHRIRLEVSSSDFDHYARNLNTGEPFGFSDKMVTAKQTVHHSKKYPSHILLPIIE